MSVSLTVTLLRNRPRLKSVTFGIHHSANTHITIHEAQELINNCLSHKVAIEGSVGKVKISSHISATITDIPSPYKDITLELGCLSELYNGVMIAAEKSNLAVDEYNDIVNSDILRGVMTSADKYLRYASKNKLPLFCMDTLMRFRNAMMSIYGLNNESAKGHQMLMMIISDVINSNCLPDINTSNRDEFGEMIYQATMQRVH